MLPQSDPTCVTNTENITNFQLLIYCNVRGRRTQRTSKRRSLPLRVSTFWKICCFTTTSPSSDQCDDIGDKKNNIKNKNNNSSNNDKSSIGTTTTNTLNTMPSSNTLKALLSSLFWGKGGGVSWTECSEFSSVKQTLELCSRRLDTSVFLLTAWVKCFSVFILCLWCGRNS